MDKVTQDKKRELNEVSHDGEWEKIRVQVDSGAFDWVTPKSTAASIPIKETESSKKGMNYVAANGTEIKNFGEKVVKGVSDEGFEISAKMQVADVKRTLGSVVSMNKTGNRVVLDGNESYVQNKKTGKKIKISLEGNQYVFYMWTRVGHKAEDNMQIGTVVKAKQLCQQGREVKCSNRYAVLASDEMEEPVFSRQDFLEQAQSP